MFIASRHSKEKIFHTQTCPYAKRIAPHNRIFYKTTDDALKDGHCPCKHCDAAFRSLRKEERAVYSFCSVNGIQIFEENHRIHIRTPRSAWILASDLGQKLRLFHKNVEIRLSDIFEKRYPGYHDQHVSYKDVLSCLSYILRHDAYRRFNPYTTHTVPSPPRKGTKRYKKQKKMEKALARKHQIGNVLTLIESL